MKRKSSILLFGLCLIALTGSRASADCRFLALGCQNNKECADYAVKQIYFFGGPADFIFDQFMDAATIKGIQEKNIANDLKIIFYDKGKNHIEVTHNPLFAETKKSRLNGMRNKLAKMKDKEKLAISASETKSKVSDIIKGGFDVFACYPDPPKGKKRHVLYELGSSREGAFTPALAGSSGKKNREIHAGSGAHYLSVPLPDNFTAKLAVTPVAGGEIVFGFGVAESSRPNYKVVLRENGAWFKNEASDSERTIEAKEDPQFMTAGTKYHIVLTREDRMVKVMLENKNLFVTTVSDAETSSMKRFFLGGSFALEDLSVDKTGR